VPAPAASRQPEPSPHWWGEVVWSQLAHYLGSLQVAVILLVLFAAVLAVGTVVESWYEAKIAQEIVYRTWWFALLLGLLWINIFFAALKKAKFRGPSEIGRDLPGKSYVATAGYWWPWIVVVSLFVLLFLDSLSLWISVPIVLVFG